jgi:hypothetical protein
MKHFLKPAVKLGLLGGVIYVAGNAGLSSLQQTQPVAVAQITSTTSGPEIIELSTIKSIPELQALPEPMDISPVVVADTTPVPDVPAEIIPAVSTPEPVEVKSTVVKKASPVQRYRVAFPPMPPALPQQYYGYQPDFNFPAFKPMPPMPPMQPMPYF